MLEYLAGGIEGKAEETLSESVRDLSQQEQLVVQSVMVA
jgi:hypothetical protein